MNTNELTWTAWSDHLNEIMRTARWLGRAASTGAQAQVSKGRFAQEMIQRQRGCRQEAVESLKSRTRLRARTCGAG